jgi:hypothetical protein
MVWACKTCNVFNNWYPASKWWVLLLAVCGVLELAVLFLYVLWEAFL